MSELGLAAATNHPSPTEDDADVDQDEETPVSAE